MKFDNKKMKRLRKERGYTLVRVSEELKKRTGVSRSISRLHRVENGANPSLELVKGLALLYGAPLDFFFIDDSIQTEMNEPEDA